MASPHAVGVAALIVSQLGAGTCDHGRPDDGPGEVEQILRSTATDAACPTPPIVDYTIVGRDAGLQRDLRRHGDLNSFYGDGIVDALKAVRGGTREGDNP